MATAAYSTAIYPSRATSSSLPRFSFKAPSRNPFLLSSIASVSRSHLSDSTIKRRRKRRHISNGASKLSSSYSHGPEKITACQWNEYVIASDTPVLVEFWASWCGPCVMVRRIIEEISQEYMENVKFYRINADDYPQVAMSYGIDQVPTVVLFKDGDKVESMTGTLPKSVYVKAIERYMS